MEEIVYINTDDWLDRIAEQTLAHHLVCSGKREDLQWFGTQLIQRLGNFPDSDTSPIYGKLATDFNDLCYQLCHATPWGFEMGRNLNAVRDVIRGENSPEHKFFMIYDAQCLYNTDYKSFERLFQIFLDVSDEVEKRGNNLKVILLLEDSEKISVRKLLKRKEKYPIATVKVIQ